MTQQTVVEWLENEYNTKGKLTVVDFYQAKAMEKEQIKLAFSIGMNSSVDYFDGVTDEDENYYQQTFNK